MPNEILSISGLHKLQIQKTAYLGGFYLSKFYQ